MASPNDATPEDIEQFLKDTNWNAERTGDTSWTLGYSGDVNNWTFTINMTEYWVYFYTNVLNKVKDECKANFYEHLAALNYKITLAKYVRNDRDGVSLGVELPRENLKAASMVNDALAALAINADQNYLELMNLANDPTKQSSLLHPPQEGQSSGS